MLNRSTILALATVATLGAAALAPTSASAFGHFGGGGMHFGGGGMHVGGGAHFGGGHFGGAGFHKPMGFKPMGFKPGHVMGLKIWPKGPKGFKPIGWKPWPHPHPHPHWPHFPIWWVHHHHHWPIGGVGYVGTDDVPVSTPVSTGYSTPQPVASAPCTCLTKTYLQDGSVLFKDLCTKEAAMATPDELKAQAQGDGPQAQ